MSFAFKMMDYCIKHDGFALNMMEFVLKLTILY